MFQISLALSHFDFSFSCLFCFFDCDVDDSFIVFLVIDMNRPSGLARIRRGRPHTREKLDVEMSFLLLLLLLQSSSPHLPNRYRPARPQ